MANLPLQFPQPTEQAIASYDWIDIAEGTGIRIFYGIVSETGSGFDYHLIGNKDAYSVVTGTIRTTTGETTLDFDLGKFNLPQTVKGTAYFSCGMGANAATVSVKVQGKKDSGGTVTNFTSEITSQTFAPGGSDSEMVFLKLAVTETNFQVGDFIRLTVKLVQAAPGTNVTVGHSPKNQDYTNITPGTKNSTIMAFHCPFRIDL